MKSNNSSASATFRSGRIARISPTFFAFRLFQSFRKNHDKISSRDTLRFARSYLPARKRETDSNCVGTTRTSRLKPGSLATPLTLLGLYCRPHPDRLSGCALGAGIMTEGWLLWMNARSIRRRCVFSVPERRGQFAGGGDSISPRGTSEGTAMERRWWRSEVGGGCQ